MKKLFMFTLIFAFVGFANAQEKTHGGKNAVVKTEKTKNNFEEWSTALGLTEAQKTEIQAINVKYEDKRASMRQTGTAQDFKALNEQRQAEIDKLLTPDQHKKADAFKQKKAEEKDRKAALKSQSK